jgi:hypothetical protein
MKISNAQSLLSAPDRIAKQCVSVALAIALLSLSATLVAEEGKTLNVCIAQHTGKDALLSQLANTLSHHKPDANTHTRLKGVQLASIDRILITDNPFKGNQATQTLSDELRGRAIQEHCDYVLVVSLPEVRTARSPQPNVWSPNQQSTTSSYDPYMRRQDPENYVRVKYQIYARDRATAPMDGFVTTHDAALIRLSSPRPSTCWPTRFSPG